MLFIKKEKVHFFFIFCFFKLNTLSYFQLTIQKKNKNKPFSVLEHIVNTEYYHRDVELQFEPVPSSEAIANQVFFFFSSLSSPFLSLLIVYNWK